MQTFSDSAKREWSLSVTIDSIQRVRSLAAVNLMDAATGDLCDRLSADPVLLGEVLYAMVQPQATAKSVTKADFFAAISGEEIGTATTALLGEIASFFQKSNPRLGATLSKALDLGKRVQAALLSQVETRLENLNPEKIASEIAAQSLNAATNSPALSESSPAR